MRAALETRGPGPVMTGRAAAPAHATVPIMSRVRAETALPADDAAILRDPLVLRIAQCAAALTAAAGPVMTE